MLLICLRKRIDSAQDKEVGKKVGLEVDSDIGAIKAALAERLQLRQIVQGLEMD